MSLASLVFFFKLFLPHSTRKWLQFFIHFDFELIYIVRGVTMNYELFMCEKVVWKIHEILNCHQHWEVIIFHCFSDFTWLNMSTMIAAEIICGLMIQVWLFVPYTWTIFCTNCTDINLSRCFTIKYIQSQRLNAIHPMAAPPMPTQTSPVSPSSYLYRLSLHETENNLYTDQACMP